ncbi:hypothetical protein BDE02_03G143500 [Populus trichocarpa]|nr:hypothetical protein BDE02_03G143500 [Populus trichocarpa]
MPTSLYMKVYGSIHLNREQHVLLYQEILEHIIHISSRIKGWRSRAADTIYGAFLPSGRNEYTSTQGTG